MTYQIPLPANVAGLIGRATRGDSVHPGLMLDKYVSSYDVQTGDGRQADDSGWQKEVQYKTVAEIVRLSAREPAGLDYPVLRRRWSAALDLLRARRFTAETVGPLTLHLARASALENAGICLHPLYGFTYLPGTGLKGMAHAYATQVWLPVQQDKQQAWERTRDVFGWGPSLLLNDIAKDLGVEPLKGSQAGTVVFHDAWPVAWPRLISDIVNNHHPKYYGSADGSNTPPPGDWENPNPVYFLAVPAGQKFEFGVAPRSDNTAAQDVELASEWLLGALCHLGAGAKTNAGYGGFKPIVGDRPPLKSPKFAEFETTVELITPAFLAGAEQKAEDCDLRPATLRGLLRWWWRTMHAGHVNSATLSAMETRVWGDAQHGGPLRIEVAQTKPAQAVPIPGKYQDGRQLRNDRNFLRHNDIPEPQGKTTQGLFYAAYGMDDMANVNGERRRRQRFCVREGVQWRVRLVARNGGSPQKRGATGDNPATIPAGEILAQAQAALWLLCQFGGVGAKGRKGFGSLQDCHSKLDFSIPKVEALAAQFRNAVRSFCPQYHAGSTGTPSIVAERCLSVEVPTPWTNSWFALDQLGAAAQEFAQAPPDTGHGKHCAAKVALGLPRKIHGPRREPIPRVQNAATHQRPVNLHGPRGDRHASPACYHVAKDDRGRFVIRALVFLTDELRDAEKDETTGRRESHQTLQQLKSHLERRLAERARQYDSQGGKPSFYGDDGGGGRSARTASTTCATPAAPALPSPNDWVTAELLEERTKKGGWRAKHLETGLEGPITNHPAVPDDRKAGDRLELVVNSARNGEITFRFPTERDKPKPPGRSGPRRGGGRGGRPGRS